MTVRSKRLWLTQVVRCERWTFWSSQLVLVGRLHRRPAATARYPIKQNGQRSFNAHTQKRTHHRFFIDYTISLITRTCPWVGLIHGLGRVWSGMGPKCLLQWVGLAHGSKSSLGTRSGLVGSRIWCVWSGWLCLNHWASRRPQLVMRLCDAYKLVVYVVVTTNVSNGLTVALGRRQIRRKRDSVLKSSQLTYKIVGGHCGGLAEIGICIIAAFSRLATTGWTKKR